MKKDGSTVVEHYLWNFENKLKAVSDDAGIIQKIFVYGTKSHVPDYMITTGADYQIITDHLGSPVVVVDAATGVVAQEIKYDSFGNVLSDTNPGFTPFGYAGCLYDQDTKLCRFGARDYDASIGRWTAKDPILFNGGDFNLYGYVENDPVNWIDPDGLTKRADSDFTYSGGGGSSGVPRSLPIKGPPNSSSSLPNKDGSIKQIRQYDGNGNPLKDIDYGHNHGHGSPHIHDWKNPPKGPPMRGPGRPPEPGEC